MPSGVCPESHVELTTLAYETSLLETVRYEWVSGDGQSSVNWKNASCFVALEALGKINRNIERKTHSYCDKLAMKTSFQWPSTSLQSFLPSLKTHHCRSILSPQSTGTPAEVLRPGFHLLCWLAPHRLCLEQKSDVELFSSLISKRDNFCPEDRWRPRNPLTLTLFLVYLGKKCFFHT